MQRTALALLLALACAAPALAREQIDSFKSEIIVSEDGTLDVTETIVVTVEGYEIRHGIVRQFPTVYEGWGGFRSTVPFDVVSVTRDGKLEPYDTEGEDYGEDLIIGSAAETVSRGPHVYVIRYRTADQVGFFDDYDSLYWNVTGNFWTFWIDEAEASVTLPGGAEPIKLAAYTGALGEAGGTATIARRWLGPIVARTTDALPPGSGLTIAIAFPKGIVQPPGLAHKAWRVVTDNPGAFLAFLGVAVLAAYGWLKRRRDGPDPEPGQVIPLFDAPKDLTPADARFLESYLFDNTSFAVLLLDLAAKGFLKIEKYAKGDDDELYRVVKSKEAMDATKLPAAERKIMTTLFTRKRSQYEFSRENGTQTRKLYQGLKSDIESGQMKFNVRERSDVTLGCSTIVLAFTLIVLFTTSGWINWLVAIAGVFAMLIVGFILEGNARAATAAGQKRRDELAGLKMYMETAEEGRWNALNPPALTPARFEALFPFALALGVDQAWSARFQRELELKGVDPATYHASFVGGSDFSLAGLTQSSFSSSFSSAVAPPSLPSSSLSSGSSSGFSDSFSSGGGFSGGGGGGGGGHGW